MRRVHIAYFKARPLTGKPSGTERGKRSELFKLVQNVLLVHVLGERVCIKKFLD